MNVLKEDTSFAKKSAIKNNKINDFVVITCEHLPDIGFREKGDVMQTTDEMRRDVKYVCSGFKENRKSINGIERLNKESIKNKRPTDTNDACTLYAKCRSTLNRYEKRVKHTNAKDLIEGETLTALRTDRNRSNDTIPEKKNMDAAQGPVTVCDHVNDNSTVHRESVCDVSAHEQRSPIVFHRSASLMVHMKAVKQDNYDDKVVEGKSLETGNVKEKRSIDLNLEHVVPVESINAPIASKWRLMDSRDKIIEEKHVGPAATKESGSKIFNKDNLLDETTMGTPWTEEKGLDVMTDLFSVHTDNTETLKRDENIFKDARYRHVIDIQSMDTSDLHIPALNGTRSEMSVNGNAVATPNIQANTLDDALFALLLDAKKTEASDSNTNNSSPSILNEANDTDDEEREEVTSRESTDYDSDYELQLARWYLSKNKEKNLQEALSGELEEPNKSHLVDFVLDPTTCRIRCPDCDRSFSTRFLARLHHDSVHLNKIYPCSICSEVFANYRRRLRHYHKEHNRFETNKPCPFPGCHKTFSNRVALFEHSYYTHRIHQDHQYTCDVCGLKFSHHKNSFEKHLLVEHSPRTPDGKFLCTFNLCSWVSKNYACLRRHLKVHRDASLQFSCDTPNCEEKFVLYVDLIHHRHTAHGTTNLKCSLCGRAFLTYKRYQKHMVNKHVSGLENSENAQMRVFFCPVPSCGKFLTSQRNIRDHMTHAHLMLKSYECAFCSASFTTHNAASHHIKNLHKDVADLSDVPKHVKVLYNVEHLNSEEAVRRICIAFQRHAVPWDFLKTGGVGLQLDRPDVTQQLRSIAEDASYGVLRKKRQKKNAEGSTGHLDPTANSPQSEVKTTEPGANVATPIWDNRKTISITLKGFQPHTVNKYARLHRRKRQHSAKPSTVTE